MRTIFRLLTLQKRFIFYLPFLFSVIILAYVELNTSIDTTRILLLSHSQISKLLCKRTLEILGLLLIISIKNLGKTPNTS